MRDDGKHAGLSDVSAQERRRRDELRERMQHDADMVNLLSSDWGRRLFYWLVFVAGGLEDASFEPTIKDGLCAALHAARSEGRRDFVRSLLLDAQRAAPAAYVETIIQAARKRVADLSGEPTALSAEVDQ